MRLYTPDTLLYPITVTKLLKRRGDTVEVNSPLFLYNYKSIVTEFDEDTRENVQRERTWPATFECELEGTIDSLDIKAGQVLVRRTLVADVEEACKHEIQYGGLCASCGLDMKERTSYNETTARSARATVNTVHGRTDLLISQDEATKTDEEGKRRLLDSRRLSLVVDLDQTIIHACVDPSIGEWQNDPSNPNYDALRDVQAFQLRDDNKPVATWYYIKQRPGLQSFLKGLSELYEMHIYTMGTRTYAEGVAKIIDPDGKVFGDRIVTRTESGSDKEKSLKRLFPTDSKMVVIIDDRADVWRWISNLVKVNVFEFFVGIGDINSSFLPKRPELEAAKSQAPKMQRTPSNKELADAPDSANGETVAEAAAATSPTLAPPLTTPAPTNGDASAIDRLVSMAGSQDAKSIQEKTEEHEQMLQEQLDDRPMLKKQKELEDLAKEEDAKASPAVEATAELLVGDGSVGVELGTVDSAQSRYRHNLLVDDDNELQYLEQSLRNIHAAYYHEYEKQAMGSKGGRVSELRPGHSTKRSADDELEHIPDAAVVMDDLKCRVLADCHIVFSGVVPLGVDPNNHDAALWAKSFGASVSQHITKKTTHVIASPERKTAKVRQAAKKPRIAVVSQHWLHACFSQWKKVDVGPYQIHSDAPVNGTGSLPESFDDIAYNMSSSEEDSAVTEDETEGSDTPNSTGLTVAIDPDEEELLKYAPSMTRQDSSPIEGEAPDDWDDMDDEYTKFMEGEDLDSESDNDSVKSGRSTPDSARKRKQDDRESDGESEKGGSWLQKRKKQAIERTTSLTNLVVQSNGSTPAADGTTEQDGGGAEDPGEDGDDDLEAALAAEMERQTEEDEGEA